jgi:C4-dicarboxylate-specific signal transduction histidine kinase
MESAAREALGKSPATFMLLLRDSNDIVLLERPPWLTVKRTLLGASVLAVVLLVALVWIRLLRRQVEARTHQLKQEIAEHEATEALLASKTQLLQREIEERERAEAEVEKIHKRLLSTSRMAGMADVATNVLHNVGNVLNSVNVVAASLITSNSMTRTLGNSSPRTRAAKWFPCTSNAWGATWNRSRPG